MLIELKHAAFRTFSSPASTASKGSLRSLVRGAPDRFSGLLVLAAGRTGWERGW